MEIEKLIASLSKEIQKTKNDTLKEEQLLRLRQAAAVYEGDDRVVGFAEIMANAAKLDDQKIISTGFPSLDKVLKGFLPSQLIVVSAATKSGKTTFCMELSAKMKEEKPLWLSFEESMPELLGKFSENKGDLPDGVAPLQMVGNTLEWVEKKIIEAKVKYGTGVVFIDHLHFIVPFTSERQDLAIGHAMRELKRMARTWNVVVVLIAHIKKARVDKNPTLDDLRDSSCCVFVSKEFR